MKKILAFGELLWDKFDDGVYIGGAPFNFCANCAALKMKTGLISAVGNDALGEKTLITLNKYGIMNDFIEINSHLTGETIVNIRNGEPSYEVASDAAFDYITADKLISEIADFTPDCFYFGSVAQRKKDSAESLEKMLDSIKCGTVFCDINLRTNCFNDESINRCLSKSDILKLNFSELEYLLKSGYFQCDSVDFTDMAVQIMNGYPKLKIIIITMGSEGAYGYERTTKNSVYVSAAKCNVVSTVGAGDAFSAGFIYAYLNGCKFETSMKIAAGAAEFVLSHKEASPLYNDEIIHCIKELM